MTNTPWTPGTWTITRFAYPGRYEIAEACEGEHEANARLIAAAPEMANLLQRLSGYAVPINDSSGSLVYAARALLARIAP